MDPFLGEVRQFPWTFAPKGWAFCAGQLLQISQNQALFSLLGNRYGGDGIQTFGLPDLRGRTLLNVGTAAGQTYAMAQQGGAETVQIQIASLPAHSHTMNATQSNGDQSLATDGLPASVGAVGSNPTINIYASSPPNIMLAADTVGSTGAGAAHNNMQPSLVLNPCISLVGIYPSRS